MQSELDSESPQLGVQIIGVNEIGHESANSLMTDGRDLPWLQDTDVNSDGQSDIWDVSWNVEFRDVVIVDSDNTRLGAFNLTTNDLGNAANFSLLKDTVLAVAEDNPIWQNDANPMDVNNDSIISPVGDVLTVINELNNRVVSDALGNLPVPANPNPPPYVDVNGDYLISPVGDVLTLVNYLNSNPAGEGEGQVEVNFFTRPDADQAPEGPIAQSQPELVDTFPAPGPTMATDNGDSQQNHTESALNAESLDDDLLSVLAIEQQR